MDEEDVAPPDDDDLDGMAGALARALAARANVIHQSGQYSLLSSPSLVCPLKQKKQVSKTFLPHLLPYFSHNRVYTSHFDFLSLSSDGESDSGEESDEEEWD